MQLSSSSSRLRPPAAHAGVPGLGGSSSIGQSIRLHHLHQQRLGPILHPHHQHPAPSSVVCSAKKGKGSGDKGDEKADAKKADFSAYWSLKVRQWFSARKDYLEGSEEQRGKRPEILKKLDEAIVEKQQEMDRLNDAERQVRMAQAARDVQADKLAGDDARKMLAPLEKALFKDGLPDMQSQLSPEQQANMDMQNARAYLWVCLEQLGAWLGHGCWLPASRVLRRDALGRGLHEHHEWMSCAASCRIHAVMKVWAGEAGSMPAQVHAIHTDKALLSSHTCRHTTPVQGVALALYRVRTVLQALLMLPFTLMAALWKGWHGLFKSQRWGSRLDGWHRFPAA